MSDIAYTIIGALILIVTVIYFAFAYISYKKKKLDTVKNIKCQVAFCAVLFVMSLIKTVGGISTQHIFLTLITAMCVLLFAFDAVLNLKTLKAQHNTSKNNADKDEKTKKDDSKEDR